ncbi:glycosyltransferase family 4 protein [Vineibacter terrae]|uniref:glycosyltransferase family 4 protein n=1 Tax=Vineibacter terrae TaxID=2586908 RepID=UPI002E36486E|nr:glycosyltransferase family 4 protein [Vineibacter terrae]HEX2886429.1 glycosyltransferase family 4 protein [Vineibacter terrae]
MAERRAIFAIPGDLDTPTGGYAYDRRMMDELRRLGWDISHVALSGAFPLPDAATLASTYSALAQLPASIPVIVDGLALGALPDVGRHLGAKRSLVALVHHPLAFETGITAARADALRTSERAALAAASCVIATSRTTAVVLTTEYGVPQARITVAPPGTDAAPLAACDHAGVPNLLSVGTLVPRKGHDLLIAALATLQDLPWRLTIVGAADRDPPTTAALRHLITQAGLDERIRLAGAVPAEALQQHYLAADLFVLASRYEGYGMAYAEAIAHGLPVIGTMAGAIPEAVPEGAALLVPPEDVPALAAALRRLLSDATARRGLARAARLAAPRLPRWQDSAALFASALVAAPA